MAQETESVETRPAPPPLKVVEPEVNPQDPWIDDVLDRKEVADRLTGIIEGQEAPFVISVDGRWGTGMFEMWNLTASGLTPRRIAISAFVPPLRNSSSTPPSAGVRMSGWRGRPRRRCVTRP